MMKKESCCGIGLPFNPLKHALKQAMKSSRARSAAIKKIVSFQIKLGKKAYDLCKQMNKKLRSWFGIKMKTITLYTKFKEYAFGKVNGKFLDKIFGAATMLFSPGAFIAGCIDFYLDGVYNERLWKIYG